MKNWKDKLALASASALILAGSASAAVDTEITDAITEAKSDALTVVAAGGAAILLIALGRVAWMVGSKWVKRAQGAA